MFHALPQRHEERSEHELQTDNGPDLKRIPTNSHLKARPIRRGPHRLGQTCTSKSERHPIEKHGGGAAKGAKGADSVEVAGMRRTIEAMQKQLDTLTGKKSE